MSGWDAAAYGVPASYVEAVRRAGGRPYILAPGEPAEVASLLEGLDGLLLIGGSDVDPARFGQERHPEVYGVDQVRDEFEIALLAASDARLLPTLCVCRGMQIMNVAFGGTLFQHLPDVEGMDDHGDPQSGGPRLHEVTIDAQTHLGEAVAPGGVRSSCHHHQGVERVGDGLRVAARASDGLVEAIERDAGWMVGVQWHPEVTANEDPAQQSVFDAFVARAAGRG